MSKPVPPKETRQSQARPAASAAAPTKAQAASAGAQANEPRSRTPQVSRAKVIEPAFPSREQIAVRAYMIWLDRGQPDGTDMENWFEAERQLAAQR